MGDFGSLGSLPAAQFEEHARAMYGISISEISLLSGPRVIPTVSAPSFSKAVISDGDSNCGPTHCATVTPLGENP